MAEWRVASFDADEYFSVRPRYGQGWGDLLAAYHSQQDPKNGTQESYDPEQAQWDTAIDLGCGPGTFTYPLAKWFTKSIGIDPSKQMLQSAAVVDPVQHLHLPPVPAGHTVEFIEGGGEQVPLPDKSVDMMTSISAIHWIDWKTQPNPWHDWARVLKPGGSSIHVASTLFLMVDKPVANKVIKDFCINDLGAYWHTGGPLEPLSLTSSLLASLPAPPEDLYDPEATVHITLGAGPELFGSPTLTTGAPKWLRDALAQTLGVKCTPEGSFPSVPITFPGSPRKFAGVMRSMSGVVQFYEEHPEQRELAKQGQDVATKCVERAIEAQAKADAVAAGKATHEDELTEDQIAPFRVGFDDPLLLGQAAGIIFARRRRSE